MSQTRRRFGAVRKLESGRWQVRYRDPRTNRLVPASVTFGRKAEAERYLASVETDQQRGSWFDPKLGRLSFGDLARQWRATVVNLRDSTLERDDGYLRRYILPTFESVPIGHIKTPDVQTWIAGLVARELAPATVVKAAQILGKVMKAAVVGGYLAASPCDGLTLPRIERQEMRFLTPEEVGALAETIDVRYRSAVVVGAYGGLRAGELFGLRAARVDLLRRRIDVTEIVTEVGGRLVFGPPKTRAGRRSVPLPRVALDALDVHLKIQGPGPDDFVFPAPEGGPVRLGLWRQRFWRPAVVGADVSPLRIHDLRHTAVALWIAAGATPNEVASRAGHSSVTTVLDRYGHLFPGSEDRLNDALDELVKGWSHGPFGTRKSLG